MAFSRLKIFGLFLGLWMGLSVSSQAQLSGIGVTSSASVLATNEILTYTISITNLNPIQPLVGTSITNTFFSSFNSDISIGFTNNIGGTNFLSKSNLVINLLPIDLAPAIVLVAVQSTNAGFLTNFISIAFNNTLFYQTNIVAQFTNVPPPLADLAVSVNGPGTPVLVNDFLNYDVTVSNLGPNAASGIFLTNTLPAGVVFRNPSSINQSVINVGSLTNKASRKFRLMVRPTTAGTNLEFRASVFTSSIADSNQVNNVAITNLTVEALVTNQLIATNISEMVFNPQISLMEQSIRLVNTGPSAVDSARVIVTGLTHWLRNAVGTNNGNPFVAYTSPLNAGQSVDLVLQYFVPTRQPIVVNNSDYIAVPTSRFDVIAPGDFTLMITNQTRLPNGAFLIEFPAKPGTTYTILYSPDMTFSNTFSAIPSIVAQADKVQWIDDGPPKTISHPSTNTSRFYRVLQNP
ncbi:MAG TPA: DUF11 domain-containing protein [Verrucomicrobiae bacterium]|nr:DUF11 domain-containing protein [Verrucomicrobiae bacterium]